MQKYRHQSDEISQNLEMYIPMEDNIKVQTLKLENNGLKKKKTKTCVLYKTSVRRR